MEIQNVPPWIFLENTRLFDLNFQKTKVKSSLFKNLSSFFVLELRRSYRSFKQHIERDNQRLQNLCPDYEDNKMLKLILRHFPSSAPSDVVPNEMSLLGTEQKT